MDSNFTLKINLPNGTVVEEVITKKMTLDAISKKYSKNYLSPILGAVYNNKILELSKEVECDGEISFLTIKEKDGKRFFIRSMFFVLVKAAKDMFPHATLHIEYTIGDGYYCFFEGLDWIRAEEVEELEKRMRDLIVSDQPFIRKEMPTEEAIKLFKEAGMEDKALLFSFRDQEKSSVYFLGDTMDYFYGYLAPSTGRLGDSFKLTYYNKGIVLMLPDEKDSTRVPSFKESPKFFNIITETTRWLDILELDTCGKLNRAIKEGRTNEVILISEALHEKKLATIADEIHRRKQVIKIVSIAGPSSSGKTTTANRLAMQLKVNGFKPYMISLDNYFIDRDLTPLDADGKNDFEVLEAINVKLFNEHLNMLMAGHEVELPRYNFKIGKSEPSGEKLRISEKGIIVVEGIHGLNPNLYKDVPSQNIFKVYVSALTQLNIDSHNRIPTTDCRILRRIVRDNQFRGHSAIDTIDRWPSVRRGEAQNIFPYQERADVMFNSSLLYEFSVLKKYAAPLLKAIPQTSPEYTEAVRLHKFLSFFEEMDDSFIPYNSILREFVGNSVFNY